MEKGEDVGPAADAVKQATRRYAKRQRTWFRREHWLTPVPGDTDPFTRVRCYAAALAELPEDAALLALLPFAARQGGDRETLLHGSEPSVYVMDRAGQLRFLARKSQADAKSRPAKPRSSSGFE